MLGRSTRGIRGRSAARGLTLIETVIAAGLSVIVAAGIYTTLNLISSFTRQGFTETRLVNRTAIAIEQISRTLNHAYRPDSAVAANRPVIAPDNQSILFTIPLTPFTNQRRQLRFDDAASTLHYERQLSDGTFVEISGTSLLTGVEGFFITNQEGILSFVVTVSADLGVAGEKRYTLVGRSLPRNL
jgi:type II secretory pathway pseudopilin PulG